MVAITLNISLQGQIQLVCSHNNLNSLLQDMYQVKWNL